MSTDTADDDTDEADETEQTPSMKGVTTDNDSTAVELSPALAVLLELIVSADDRSGSSRQELIDDTLEGFLSSTIGSELDSEQFETTDKMTVNLECDPVLTRVLERFT